MVKKIILLLVLNTIIYAQIQWPDCSDSKPWTRWWWHGNAVDSVNIQRQLYEFHKAGLGGVEITSIYAVQNNEQNNIHYLSFEYGDILNFTLETAMSAGLQVDLPMGTGWRNGGPWIEKENADSRLVVEKYQIEPATTFCKHFETTPIAVLAVSKDERVLIRENSSTDFRFVNDSRDSLKLYLAFQQPSGAKVKRPSPGGEGYAFNPFSQRSTRISLKPFQDFFQIINTDLIRCQFHDSYEYTGNWSIEIFEFFQNMHGYDLAKYLPELKDQGDAETIARVKCDYRECLSELLQQHFLSIWKEIAGEYHHKIRNQGHGSPANLLDVYALADIPETEIFAGDQEFNVLKFASSAAHVMGRPLVSAESFTWQDEHFCVTLDSMKSSADLLFCAGINHIFYHGTAYSPAEAAWPGWVFYASTQINPQNSLWNHLPKFNNYIARVQSFLRQGQPDNDVLIYWPVYDEWMKPDGLMQKFTVHDNSWITENAAGAVADQLKKSGFLYDFISDKQLTLLKVDPDGISAPGGAYKSIIIPSCCYLSKSTLMQLIELADKGADIIFQLPLPTNVPGYADHVQQQKDYDDLLTTLYKKLGNQQLNTNIFGIKNLASTNKRKTVQFESDCMSNGLEFCRRRINDGKYIYFLVNKSGKPIDDFIHLEKLCGNNLLFNPMTGKTGMAEKSRIDPSDIRIQLQKGESIIVHTDYDADAKLYPYQQYGEKKWTISGNWKITFVNGGPSLPPTQYTDSLVTWTNLHKESESFAGTALYEIEFDAPENKPGSYLLNLGKVAESAIITFNNQTDTLIVKPFCVRLDNVNAKNNTLFVEITNTAANRIRDLDRHGLKWKIFEDINVVNKNYQSFDASDWPVKKAGLLGPVTLTKLKTGPDDL